MPAFLMGSFKTIFFLSTSKPASASFVAISLLVTLPKTLPFSPHLTLRTTGNGRLTEDNYQEYLEEVESFYSTFDFNSLFDQIQE